MTVIATGIGGEGEARRRKNVSPLRQRMIRDMDLAGLAPGTQRNYIGAVLAVQKHFQTRPDRLSEEQVYRYILWLREEKGVAKGTFQTRFNGLRFFYLCSLGYDWALFTRKKVRQPRQKRLPVALSPEECQRLIAAIDKRVYRLCCTSMYILGLRLTDAITLPIRAIDGTRHVVRIISKGNKERIVPLPEPLLQQWRAFWRTHRHPTWLFPNMAGTGHLCRKSLYRAFNSARDRAGLPSEVKLHCLRHSFATHLLANGVELRVVQMLLGHASIRSTERYTHLTQSMRTDLQNQLGSLVEGILGGGPIDA